jgi:NAD(P)H-dependent FMN reductase
MEQLKTRVDADFQLVDLRDFPLPFFNNPLPPVSGQCAPEAAGWAEIVGAGDGYMIITPEYNHGYPAVLKNALDHVYREWKAKPVAFVSYGGVGGGQRAVEQLRSVAAELQMIPTREQLAIPLVWMAFDESGAIRQQGADQALKRMVDELLVWTQALKSARSVAEIAA